jgi:hypothetical protein
MEKRRKATMASQKRTRKDAAGDLMHPHYVALRNIRKNDDKSTIVQ